MATLWQSQNPSAFMNVPTFPRCFFVGAGGGLKKTRIIGADARRLAIPSLRSLRARSGKKGGSPDFNQGMLDKAHAHGVKCNGFYADDPELAAKYLNMGVDCILNNDYLAVKTALEEKGLL